jgi:argonaute-like protein implicated in RNA metabolism and viral defense
VKENVPFRIYRMLNTKIGKPLSGDYYFLDDYNVVLCAAGGEIYEHGTPKPIVAEIIPIRGKINVKAIAEGTFKLAFPNWGSPGRSYSVPAPIRMAHELASELSLGIRRTGLPF